MSNEYYTGEAMFFLQGYASDAYDIASAYLDALYNYTAEEVDTSGVPDINIDVAKSIEIDPSLAEAMPDTPADSEYPDLPSAPSLADYDFPTKPDYELPAVPTLTDIVIPDFIEGTMPTISTTIPTMDFDAPALPEIEAREATHDSLFQTIQDRLEGNILNGGTTLDPDVENDIWQRDLERSEQALQDAIDKATGQWAKFGFSMPDGLLSGALLALNNEYMNRNIDRSREIAIKQAEMEHDGLFKSLELGISIENIVMTSQNEYAQRVLEAQKATVDSVIKLFETRILRYNTMLETYKADVLAYKTEIESEIARVEAYKARIGGAQALAQMDETRVRAYTSQVAAVSQLVELYNTEVKSVATMYEAERNKIERYKTQIDAYVGAVDGVTKKYVSEVEGYKAYIQSWVATSDSQTKLSELDARAQIAEIEANIKEWEIQIQRIQEGTQVKLEALKTVATTASNLAAGALSAIHASVSDSYSKSYQNIDSHQYLE